MAYLIDRKPASITSEQTEFFQILDRPLEELMSSGGSRASLAIQGKLHRHHQLQLHSVVKGGGSSTDDVGEPLLI
jgi:hypothetical protein